MSTKFYRGYNTGSTAKFVYSDGRVYKGPTTGGSAFLACEESGNTCRIHNFYNTGSNAEWIFNGKQMYKGPTAGGNPFITCEFCGNILKIHNNYNSGSNADYAIDLSGSTWRVYRGPTTGGVVEFCIENAEDAPLGMIVYVLEEWLDQ